MDATFSPTLGQIVHDIAVQPDQKILVVGSIHDINDDPSRNWLVRLAVDGATDTSCARINLGGESLIFGSPIVDVAVASTGSIYIAGTFGSINGVTRPGLARLSATCELDATFQPAAGGSVVLPRSNGQVIVATGTDLHRLNADGSRDMTFVVNLQQETNTRSNGVSLFEDGQGRVHVAGTFTHVNGVAQRGLARLTETGSLDPGFLPVIDGNVRAALVMPAGDVRVAVDDMTLVEGPVLARILGVTAEGGVTPCAVVGAVAFWPFAAVSELAALPDGRLLFAGLFVNPVTAELNSVGRLTPDCRRDERFQGTAPTLPVVHEVVAALAVDGSQRVLLGGLSLSSRSLFRLHAQSPSVLSVSTTELRFSAVREAPFGQILTSSLPTTIDLGFAGVSPEWRVETTQTWLEIDTVQGAGVGRLTIRLTSAIQRFAAGESVSGLIRIAAPTAAEVIIPVTLHMLSASATSPPIGQVDTPAQGAVGVQGAIAMTGWVVDDVGIQHVRIYRQCLDFDHPAACQEVLGTNVVLVGQGSIIAGARPDVEALFPTLPAANSAGWGFLILSNLLPNIPVSSASGGGVGTFTLYAVATDQEGNQKLLGRTVNDATPTTVTVANDVIAKPFGAIDTPGQGATVSGILNNFGWVLTPDPGTSVLVPTDGSTINVFIDGASVGTATYDLCRGSVGNPVPAGVLCDDDVSSIFRNAGSFRNLDAARGAIGLRSIDTMTLTNGLHTISWGVTDSANRSEGIGSRYFNVLNSPTDAWDFGTSGLRDSRTPGPAFAKATAGRPRDLVYARTGYDLQAAFTPFETNTDGVPQVRIPEHGRIELQLPGVVDGALIVNGESRTLPVGVGIDRARGIVTWVAGPGYLGTYRLQFGSTVVDVTVHPQAAADQPIRMHIDRVDRDGRVITVQGWGLDPHAVTGSGIGAVHVWARRRDGAVQGSGFRVQGASAHSEAPVFLGTATLGLARPDVAAAHGAQFPHAGFVFTGVLPDSGEWEVTAYVWVTRTGRFEDARRVTTHGR